MRNPSLGPMVIVSGVVHSILLLFLLSVIHLGAQKSLVTPPVQVDLVEVKKPPRRRPKELDASRILLHNPNQSKTSSEPKEARYLADKAHRAMKETREEGGFSLPGRALKPAQRLSGRAGQPKTPSSPQKGDALPQENGPLASIPKLQSQGIISSGQGRVASLPKAGGLFPNPEDMTKASGTPAANLDEAIQKGQLIDLNTKEFKYTSYFLSIKYAVEGDMSYPEDMALKGISGDGIVAFTVEKNGTVSEARIVKSSGYPSFDHEILMALHMASPLNPIPQRLEKDRLFLVWPFDFIINRFFS